MGLYGSPELFPVNNNGSPPPKKLTAWNILFIAIGSIFCLFLVLFMYSGVTAIFMPWIAQGHILFMIPVIATIAYVVMSFLFFINYAKGKKSKVFLGYSVLSIVIFIISMAFNPSGQSTNIQANKSGGLTLDEYKPLCSSYAYEEIARNPNNYVGKDSVFTGQVIQVQESGDLIVLRVNVTKDENNFWKDTLYVEYTRKSKNESRILENDIVNLYGTLNGIKTYTSVLGQGVSIPYLSAEFIILADDK